MIDETRPTQPALRGNTSGLGLLGLFLFFSACCIVFLIGYFVLRPEPNPPALDFSALQTSTPVLVFPSPAPPTTIALVPSATVPSIFPDGQIVFVCQLDRDNTRDQLCIMNADGSDYHQLTDNRHAEHYYPSFAPDGKSVVFSSNQSGEFEIWETDLSGNQRQLTVDLGELNAPAISPDGTLIAFTRIDSTPRRAIWVMARDGLNPRQVYGPPDGEGWDPTWSPDGSQILFASYLPGTTTVQLFVVNVDGTGLHQITSLDGLRGRTDWSRNGEIVTYAGTSWHRELYLLNADGSNLRQVSPSGGNSQGPGFSPDGQWIVFTAYFDLYNDINGCEIYRMRVDGTRLTRLTDNAYCDWQPRWGP